MTDQITNVYWYESSRSRVRIKLRIYFIRTNRGRRRSIIGGAHIHIFVFTDCKNNRFQKKLMMHNTNIWICAPPLIDLPRPLRTNGVDSTVLDMYGVDGFNFLFMVMIVERHVQVHFRSVIDHVTITWHHPFYVSIT